MFKMLRRRRTTVDLTPLHFAVEYRHKNIVDILLENGANVNAVCEDGLVPLHLAVIRGHIEIFKTLLKHGANVELNLKGNITPLHIAANSSLLHTEIVECILQQHNLDVNLQDNRGMTALHIAVAKGNHNIVPILLEKGSDINIITKQGKTPLDLAIGGMHQRYNESGRELLLYKKCESMVLDIKLHTIKLKAAGLHVSEKNLRWLKYNVDRWELEEILDGFSYGRELYEFELECRKELKEMKSSRSGVDLHDVLTTKFPRYILNKTLVRDLESFNYKKFPVYGSLVESKFISDRKRIVLLESSKKSWEIATGIILPNEIVEKILSYLKNRDLRILCTESLANQSNTPNSK